jgi:hypothetical protein
MTALAIILVYYIIYIRTKKFKEENQALQKQVEAERLQFELEKKTIEVEKKNTELTSMALKINHKDNLLDQIKQKILATTDDLESDLTKKKLKALIENIDSVNKTEEEWENFEKYFNQVHHNFIHRMKLAYPNLSPANLKLCFYIRMNLSPKEMTSLLNISVRGIEKSRYRLKKKIGLSQEEDLTSFILSF